VMMIKRHTRPNPAKQIKGGIAERESPIQASNVLIVCPGCGKAVRIAHHVDPVAGGKNHRTRVCRKCGQSLDRK
jgi:large subunit ribosomal protein L24